MTCIRLNQKPSKTSQAMIEIFKKCVTTDFANFNGRARRREYWLFCLAMVIIGVIFGILSEVSVASGSGVFYGIVNFLIIVVNLALVIPSLAVQCRRLHDTGRSGLWILLMFVPIIGPIVLLVFSLLDGDHGDNKYGAAPKM